MAADETAEDVNEQESADQMNEQSGGQGAEDASGGGSEINPVEFAEGKGAEPEKPLTMDLLMDVNLPVRVELGRTTLSVSELLEMGPGSVIELDKMAGEPAELYIRDTFFARGEVVVVDNNFGLRITELSERAEEFGEEYG